MRDQEGPILLKSGKLEVSYLLSLPQSKGQDLMFTPRAFTGSEEQQDIRAQSVADF